jgi:hypothetical protein
MQARQPFAGSSAPLATNAPPIQHPATQAPEGLQSLPVPQDVPAATGVQAVVLVLGAHALQGSVGLGCPAAE